MPEQGIVNNIFWFIFYCHLYHYIKLNVVLLKYITTNYVPGLSQGLSTTLLVSNSITGTPFISPGAFKSNPFTCSLGFSWSDCNVGTVGRKNLLSGLSSVAEVVLSSSMSTCSEKQDEAISTCMGGKEWMWVYFLNNLLFLLLTR